jgi:hypothetical protein
MTADLALAPRISLELWNAAWKGQGSIDAKVAPATQAFPSRPWP